ncbi:hypothetical protein LJC04_05420 [Ruminococcaceae bacterium OttesenSCG-928-O06]|nr:hypothetical protein [Ruminococcaceae bacterium OttesenSCG-928-O06]
MPIIAKSDFMLQTLSTLLETGESLQYPLYGTIEKIGKERQNLFGFFGVAGDYLLIAILSGTNAEKITESIRVPLEIEKCIIKKSIIPNQYKVHLIFTEGNDVVIRVSKKLLVDDFYHQEENVTAFLDFVSMLENG